LFSADRYLAQLQAFYCSSERQSSEWIANARATESNGREPEAATKFA
jgi:hypothetical protein